MNGLADDNSLQAAAECLGVMCRETKDVDESVDTIQVLLPQVLKLRPRIRALVEEDDIDGFKAITRVFADAGDSWTLAIAREPQHFRPLVDALLECCALDKERDVIHYTFTFWYELKQYLTLGHYMEARVQLVDVFARLVAILLKHLEYPESDTANQLDLFEGDREQEEKFREFRHHMGDTLKDSCEVMGVAECLTLVLNSIKTWHQKYGSQATDSVVPHWQSLEAPLFAMRAMGRMVDKEESTVLPQIMPLLVQMPVNNEKLRFAAIMVFGRYTEWTSAHPESLEPQFAYIIASFQTESQEVLRAAAQAFKYFCVDCKDLLGPQVGQLQVFYDQILDKLPEASKEEMTEGVATVVGAQKAEDSYRLLKLYCDPLVQRLMVKANNATDEKAKLDLAGESEMSSPIRSVRTNNSFRSYQPSHPLFPASRSLCAHRCSQPCGQVLGRGFPHSLNHPRQLYRLHPHLREDLPILAVHGHLLQDRHDALVGSIGQQPGGRLRKVEAGLLSLGY